MRRWWRELQGVPWRKLLSDTGHVLASGGLCLIYCPHGVVPNTNGGRIADAIKKAHDEGQADTSAERTDS